MPLRKRAPWAANEIEYLETNYSQVDTKLIANALGRSVNSVRWQAHKMGLRKTHQYLRHMGERNIRHRPDLT